MIAFWSWYGELTSARLSLSPPKRCLPTPASFRHCTRIMLTEHAAFPPLLSDVIAKDIAMEPYQVANSNIIALTATYVSCHVFKDSLAYTTPD